MQAVGGVQVPAVVIARNIAAMTINSGNRQVAGFALSSIGWILCMSSMGFVEWQMWHTDDCSHATSCLASVGIWRVCVYHYNFSKAKVCHQYTYRDTFLPPAIRAAQHLLMAAAILGLLGRAFNIFALRNVYMGILQNNATCRLFIASGILNITAGVCILIAVLWNYYSILNPKGIAFPPAYHWPFKPDTQEIGSAIIVATIAAFLMFLSGLLFLSYKFPLDNPVHPKVREICISRLHWLCKSQIPRSL
ncbi:claudin-34-like [Cynocephalus volans]|uniref:claudin-34-like n=1 Tax=Cynocephalus volans TaxID=110931 RepID=UPI002FCB8724